ncbi:MAG: hypothetical protein A2166_02725, partial [Omnitrophica WOR_2 bacterium RBG_13_41_10]
RHFFLIKNSDKIKKILIIKFWGMGSILLASPVLRAIKKKFPESQLYFLTLIQNKDICRTLKIIDNTMCLDVKNLSTFLIGLWRLFRTFRKEKFDLVIDLEFFTNFTALVTFITGSNYTVGFQTHKRWRNKFYTHRVTFAHDKHIRDIFLKMAHVLDIDTKDKSLERPFISVKERKAIEQLFRANNIRDDEILITLNINAHPLSYNRRWPKENFVRLNKGLLERKNVRIFLIGGKDDKRYVDDFKQLFEHSPRVINLCNRISLEELVALLERCDLLITNDSGPLHLATALEMPTVSFFGPETPSLYGPIENEHIIFYKDLPCSPCLNVYTVKTSDCQDNKCMKAITVEEVLEKVNIFLEKFNKKRKRNFYK